MMGEGMHPVRIECWTTDTSARNYPGITNDPTDEWGAAKNTDASSPPNSPLHTPMLERTAIRMDMAAGSEALLNDASVEIGGAVVFMVRKDDELDALRPHAGWQIFELETGETYDVFSVSDVRVRGGERRWKFHCKPAIAAP